MDFLKNEFDRIHDVVCISLTIVKRKNGAISSLL